MKSETMRWILATSALAWVVAAPAHGQDTPPSTSAPGSAGSGSGIADIVVTAQKRSENLQKAPVAITAIGGATLTEKGVTNLTVAQELVPGARFHQEGNTVQVFLRGVGSNLDFANVQPSVAFNFNGIFIPREGTSVGLYDIDRFEVLPGPQGTLYGRSAIGGTVNVSFRKPEFVNGGSFNLEAGNYNLAHVTGVANYALSNTLAVRAVADYIYRSGFMHTDSDSKKDFSGRLSALWKPNDDVSLYVWGYTAQKHGNTPNLVNKGSKPVYDANGNLTGFVYDENAFLTKNPYNDSRPGQLASTAPFGQPTTSTQHYNNWAGGAQLDVKLGDHVTLTDIPGYVYLNAITNVYWLGAIPAYKHDEYHQASNELRLSGDIGSRLNWLTGLYLYHNVQQGQGIVGTANGPASVPAGSLFPFYSSHVLRNRLEGGAVFGQATYKIGDKLRLTAGARYGIDKTKANGISLDDQVTPYFFNHTVHRFDYKVGAQYDITPRIMAYAQFQTGYQPATFNEVANLPGRSNLVKSGKLKSVSGGIKSRWFNNTLQINDEIFYSVYNDLQTQAYDASALYNPIFNAKKVSIPGNQLDILWEPTRNDKINLSVSYIKYRNKNFVEPNGLNFNGLSGPYAADWTINGGISHDFQMRSGYVRASVDGHYESKWYADFVHNLGTRQDAYAKLNAELIYYSDDGRYNFGFWGRNLTNKVVIAATAAAGIPGPATAYLDAPRTYGIRGGFKF
ncbi:TonB-dependent receptor [Sphingomonas oryzagri]|uniref:TonB-dependent receptor n=1 Tax=Sphingomonas oryzagri TaxID=3042314 RepID=A0ABT6N156_9SPHN|nr:TonB-dependent receptor [Sphingomonas oryzagri]MDH7639040.1 TonB-dependent receptor [Sphingomonas oryzagri]